MTDPNPNCHPFVYVGHARIIILNALPNCPTDSLPPSPSPPIHDCSWVFVVSHARDKASGGMGSNKAQVSMLIALGCSLRGIYFAIQVR